MNVPAETIFGSLLIGNTFAEIGHEYGLSAEEILQLIERGVRAMIIDGQSFEHDSPSMIRRRQPVAMK